MITPTWLNKKRGSPQIVSSEGGLVQYSFHDSLLPLNVQEKQTRLEAAQPRQARYAPKRDGLFRVLNKVELPVEHSHYSDEELLQLIAQRDANALSEIYDRHAQTVYNLMVRIVREPAIAEDLLQETFWQVWEKAESFSGSGVAAAWLYRIARNKSLDHLRRKKTRPQPAQKPISEQIGLKPQDVHLTSVEIEVERTLQRTRVQDALASIPPEQRQCLELAYFNGMSQRQIAEYTDTPLGTIKTRVRQGLKKLERILRAVGLGQANILLLFLIFDF